MEKATTSAASKGKKKKGGGFQSMGLSPAVFRAVMGKGYNLPTPIQRKAIPKILAGQSIVATARTGIFRSTIYRKWEISCLLDPYYREDGESLANCGRKVCYTVPHEGAGSPNSQIFW